MFNFSSLYRVQWNPFLMSKRISATTFIGWYLIKFCFSFDTAINQFLVLYSQAPYVLWVCLLVVSLLQSVEKPVAVAIAFTSVFFLFYKGFLAHFLHNKPSQLSLSSRKSWEIFAYPIENRFPKSKAYFNTNFRISSDSNHILKAINSTRAFICLPIRGNLYRNFFNRGMIIYIPIDSPCREISKVTF